MEGMRIDLAPAGIKVTDVQPGFVDTPMTQSNKFPQPFKWDAPKAARYIADQLESAPGIVAFPFPLTFLTRLAQLLPFRLHAAATRAMRGGH
jgi:NAD(P)-dependent dehydrogenase (short-subunit alcohol dehydrogenase family)